MRQSELFRTPVGNRRATAVGVGPTLAVGFAVTSATFREPDSKPRVDPMPGQAAAVAILLAGGIANGLAARVIEAWKAHGAMAAASLFGISPFEIVVVVVALSLLLRAGDKIAVAGLPWLALPYVALILYPSSLVSWAGLVLLAAAGCALGTPAVRTPLCLAAGLGCCVFWSIVGEPLASSTVLALDAHMVMRMLSVLRDDIFQAGNVVGNAEHRIVVLTGCSSLHVVPLAVLGWFALRLANGRAPKRGDILRAGLLAAAIVVLNLVRLCGMAWSATLYGALHGDIGGMAFDGLLTIVIVAAALVGRRRE